MKTIHLSIIVILLISLGFHYAAFAQNYTNSSILPEGSNLPVIITQVELDSPYKLVPENISCAQWNATAKPGPFCLENLVPNQGVECGIFMGSATCEPLHVTNITNPCIVASGFFANGTAVKDITYEYGEQWVTLYNRLDTSITASHFEVSPNEDWHNGGYYGSTLPYHVANPPSIAPYLVMGPHQSCTYGFFAIDEPLSVDNDNSTLTVLYVYNGTQYQSTTPPFTDNYGDTRTWQLEGNKWVFAEQNTVTVPEFPFAVPVLLTGVMASIIFYRMKFRK